MLLKVKAVLFAESELQEVVIKRFLADSYFSGSFFEAVSHLFAVYQDPVVQLAPESHTVDNVGDASFLGSPVLVRLEVTERYLPLIRLRSDYRFVG